MKKSDIFEDNYFTRKRKLKIEEYDDNGVLIDVIELPQIDLWNFYMYKNNNFNCIDIARKSDREYFSGEKLNIVKKMINLLDKEYFSINSIKKIEKIFEQYTMDQINFALEFKDYFYNISKYMFIGEDEQFINKLNFIQVLEYLKLNGGFWYAIDEYGNIGMSYLKEPTKKQAKYQRIKRNKKIVYFDFNKFEDYSINEDDLI